MQEKIKVIIAVSSGYHRLVLDDIISAEQDMGVKGQAAGADELLAALHSQQPDVVVLDNMLPDNRDFLVLKRIFSEKPTPVILLIAKEKLSLELVKQATELGVYAIVLKPGPAYYTNYRGIASEVISKVRAVRHTPHWDSKERLAQLQQELSFLPLIPAKRLKGAPETVIVIGASTGGTQALETIVKQLSPMLQAAVVIVVHLPKSFTESFAARLRELTKLKVEEGREGLLLKQGKIIVAPGGKDIVVVPVMGNKANLKVGFSTEPSDSFDQPSIDLLMQSVAESEVKQVIGVILTGMGKDGTKGAGHIQSRGGLVIAQDEETSLIFGMAKSAIDSGFTNQVLPLADIPHYLNRLSARQDVVSATGTAV